MSSPNLPFQHLIITRFNLKVTSTSSVIDALWTRDRENREVQTEQWLKERFNLFEAFCLPSVVNQTEKDFKWLVYFDENTPEAYKQKISKWETDLEFFTPIYKPSYNHFMKEINQDIKAYSPNKPYIITTRLDNDDSLHTEASLTIKDHFIPVHNTPINLAKGYCFNLNSENKIQIITTLTLKDGPFVSLIEQTDKALGVYNKKHGDYLNISSTIQIQERPLWAQIIHEGNMVNFMRGSVKRISDIESDFGVSNKLLNFQSFKEIKHQVRHILRLLIPLKLRMAIFNFLNKSND
ncbi:glycosyltransferase [Fulvivirga ligni]|uniref:glycosyltransferase n=1 Tax=Fulvivirga ligni TaxID=2904246 RepID=UPI001F45547D|nr:glycosyltransferase [Fulvivirga ligni]UII23670.1 putative rhamnosyl transferase [Fulvivirga ligni]